MEKDRSRAKKDTQPPRKDDLTRIKGISPRIEKKLNESIGCYTFAQVAALKPTDIAEALTGLSGVSRNRIIELDWVGQARNLAAGETQKHVEAPASVEPPAIIEDMQIASPSTEPEQAPERSSEASSQVAREYTEAPVEPEQMEATNSEAAPEEIETPATPELDAGSTTLAETPVSVEAELPAPLPEELRTEAMAAAMQQPTTIFTVEFLLDENNGVASTRVLHNQSGRELTWVGWQNTQLADFMIESAALNISSEESKLPVDGGPAHTEESEPAPVVVPKSEPPTPIAEKLKLTGLLRLSGMEVLGAGSNISKRTLAMNEPFDVCLTLDLNELKTPSDASLSYKASIYGRCQGLPGLVLREVQGSLVPAGTVIIKVEENTLPVEGIYKLAAQVIVGLPGEELKVSPGTTTVISGGQIQVY